MKRKNPPTIVKVDGTSLIPNNGSQTQKIPPITSVKDNKVNSIVSFVALSNLGKLSKIKSI